MSEPSTAQELYGSDTYPDPSDPVQLVEGDPDDVPVPPDDWDPAETPDDLDITTDDPTDQP